MSETGEIEDLPNNETLELDEWAPDKSLRPHHFFNPDIQAAFRKNSQRISRTELILRGGRLFERATDKMSSGYYRDVVGDTSADFADFQMSKNEFIEQIESMPDDAVICFDIKPDEICNSCVIGKHCTATNVRTRLWPFPVNDWEEKESKKLAEIETLLKEKGAKEGIDYIFRDSDHIMFDFDKKPLNQMENPTPKEVKFRSMLAKTGALRKIAA